MNMHTFFVHETMSQSKFILVVLDWNFNIFNYFSKWCIDPSIQKLHVHVVPWTNLRKLLLLVDPFQLYSATCLNRTYKCTWGQLLYMNSYFVTDRCSFLYRLTKISNIVALLIIYRIPVYSGFGLDRFHSTL